MKAVIMAGGEGSRLRPLTCDLPKPMVPILNIPMMEHIIELLRSHGITDIAVTLMYLPQKIRDYFGNGNSFGVNIEYFVEELPLGTAGSVKNAEAFLDDTFLVISGDCLTDMDITKAIQFHRQKRSLATIVLAKVDVPLEYGVVITNEDGRVTGFLEKPSWGEVLSDTVNTGAYIFEPEILNYIKRDRKLDFSQNIFPLLLSHKESVYGYIMTEYWCDVGDIQAYYQAHQDILEGRIKVKNEHRHIRPGVWIGNGSVISPRANINPPCVIGKNCRISSGVNIDGMTVIGNNNVIEEKASLKRGITWNNNYIERGVEVRGSILCNKVNVKNNASIFENSVIGDGCVVNERAMIKPNVRVWPHKIIDPMAIVDRNIIWASKHTKTIFGENGISGIINVDVNPEFATRIGAACGSILKKGSKVVVSSTTSNSARMFKHAFISGLLSVGIEVFNLSSLLTPIARHAIGFLAVEGGIHIKLCNDNPNKIRVDFMDAKGVGISRVIERKIENTFIREDFNRCSGEEISRLNNITDFKNYYVRSILNELDLQKIRTRGIKVCIFSPSDFVISIIVPMLTDLGCKVVSYSSGHKLEDRAIAENIKNTGAEFGAFIDGNAESLVLIDREGEIITEDKYIALTSLIIFKSKKEASVVVPMTAPSILEKIANKHGGNVIRTKSSSQAVMEQLLNNNTQGKNHLFQYYLNFDALAGLVKIIEFLSINSIEFSDLLKEIPAFHISKKKIFCPWELKGKVMRFLISEENGENAELSDGAKFLVDGGWALIIPDADLPMFRVISEGDSFEVAETNVNKYLDKITTILRND